jgi:hypothetical protein
MTSQKQIAEEKEKEKEKKIEVRGSKELRKLIEQHIKTYETSTELRQKIEEKKKEEHLSDKDLKTLYLDIFAKLGMSATTIYRALPKSAHHVAAAKKRHDVAKARASLEQYEQEEKEREKEKSSRVAIGVTKGVEVLTNTEELIHAKTVVIEQELVQEKEKTKSALETAEQFKTEIDRLKKVKGQFKARFDINDLQIAVQKFRANGVTQGYIVASNGEFKELVIE